MRPNCPVCQRLADLDFTVRYTAELLKQHGMEILPADLLLALDETRLYIHESVLMLAFVLKEKGVSEEEFLAIQARYEAYIAETDSKTECN